MTQQRHVIKRQVIEVSLANKDAAWSLQQALSRLCQHHFPAIIDHYLSEFSPADCIHRIDHLELDLGELDSASLEVDILDRLGEVLTQALREQIGTTQAGLNRPITTRKRSQLEILEYFLNEGNLPWWVDHTQKHVPEKSLTMVLDNDPKALLGLFLKLIQQPRCLHRIISYFDDESLIAVLTLLTAAPQNLVISLIQTLQAVTAPLQEITTLPLSKLRFTLWQSLLQVAQTGEPSITRNTDFLKAITVRWAKMQGLTHSDLIACLQETTSTTSFENNRWLQAISGLSIPLGNLTNPPDDRHSSNQDSADKKNSLEAESNSTSNPSDENLEMPSKSPQEITHRLSDLGLTTDSSGLSASDGLEVYKLENSTSKKSDVEENQVSIETTEGSLIFSDTDMLYINNAGLCILWPYLETFFERLGLVTNGCFQSQAAQQCAVSLLHYLATGELDPPEYFLPFNKLLCAMAIDEVFDLVEPLTTVQMEACDELLAAVIANAPILSNMSLPGFRGSFLLRQGILSVEGGSWLLRVAQETYDVVLERFPWTWQWFKLPWMEHPVRVEW